MPGVVVDEAKRTVHIDTPAALGGLEELYGRYLEDDVAFFRISPECAAGLYEFLDAVKALSRRPMCVKGQVTGPASMALALTDKDKVPIIYNGELFEAITKLLGMKARWQVRKMKELCDEVIIFIDEPYLVSLGSSYVNIDSEKTMEKIDEVADAIRGEGAYAGLHCCGNTDWPAILGRNIDILSFDAYNFIKEFMLFKDDIKKFLARGGTIAWGIIPTSSVGSTHEDAEGLFPKLREGIGSLGEGGGDMSSLVTPSCGTGTLSETAAKEILNLTAELANIAKGRAAEL